MSTATKPTSNLPPDNPQRTLTLAQPDNLPHIGVVGDTYTADISCANSTGHIMC